MQIINKLIPIKRPAVLSIGMFDGVHTGHLSLISELKKKKGLITILTYANHPKDILDPQNSPPLIYSLEEKLKLLEDAGVDLTIVLPFTKTLARQSFYRFLENLQQYVPFFFLALGEKASFGYNRLGTPQKIKDFGAKHQIEVKYILKKENVSSSLIRKALKQKKIAQAEQMLGRKILCHHL